MRQMEDLHDHSELSNPDSKGQSPMELLKEKLTKMDQMEIEEEKIDKFMEERTRMEEMLIKRHEINNLIVRFGNFKNSAALTINFKELDNIKDSYIMGVPCLESNNNSDNYANCLNNMNEYWHLFEKQLRQTNNSMKPTDQKALKMIIIERMLPEYTAITIDNVITHITNLAYA